MELLPDKKEDFKTKEYWEKFFKNRKGLPFEWYVDYATLKAQLHKEIQAKHRILVAGCGNSTLSEQLYDDGFQAVTSIDYLPSVIAEMQARVKDRKGLVYQEMDIMHMTYPDGSFDTVLDKATLDAIYTEEDPSTNVVVEQMWNNILRVLTDKGRYIVISMLDSHILSKVLSFFRDGNHNTWYADHAFVIKIYEINKADETGMLPFMLVVDKLKINLKKEAEVSLKNKMMSKIFYVSGKIESVSVDQAIANVKNRHIYGYMMQKSKSFALGQRFKIDCFETEREIPKYTMWIVDSKSEKMLKKRTMAVFIAPLGRETDFLFATEEGNFNLISDSGYSRLIIVILNHLHSFGKLEDVQKELSPKLLSLAPTDCTNTEKIPFLKIGEDIGKREIVLRSDGILIEDVQDFDGSIIRRMFFEKKIGQVQSEANLKIVSQEESKGAKIVTSPIVTLKPNECAIINHNVLCSDYARASVALLSAIASRIVASTPDNPFHIIVLGTGAGSLTMFYAHNIPNTVIDTVDCDATILKIAPQYFGFEAIPKKVISHCCDAEKFMKDTYLAKKPYDLVVIDMNNPDISTGVCPGKPFLDKEFLESIKQNAEGRDVAIILNLICRQSEETYKKIVEMLNAVFTTVLSIKSPHELNQVFLLIHSNKPKKPKEFNIATLADQIHVLQKFCDRNWTKSMNVLEHLDNLEDHSKKPKEGETKKKKK